MMDVTSQLVIHAGTIIEPQFVIDPPGHTFVDVLATDGTIRHFKFTLPQEELLDVLETFIRRHTDLNGEN